MLLATRAEHVVRMGLFDFLSSNKGDGGLKKHAERVANKRAQALDRWDSIKALAAMGTKEAAEALLPRFSFYVDPSITDQEEKDLAFEGVVKVGPEAVEPVQRYAKQAESLSWPLKLLDRLVNPDAVRLFLVGLLATMDVEYERDPQRKVQILAELETRTGEGVESEVARFLADVHEPARFHAVGALLAQPNAEAAREKLLSMLPKEESMRVKTRVLDGFAARGWAVDPGTVGQLPQGFRIGADGVPIRA